MLFITILFFFVNDALLKAEVEQVKEAFPCLLGRVMMTHACKQHNLTLTFNNV